MEFLTEFLIEVLGEVLIEGVVEAYIGGIYWVLAHFIHNKKIAKAAAVIIGVLVMILLIVGMCIWFT